MQSKKQQGTWRGRWMGAVLGGLVLVSASAQAADFSVGRVEVQFAEAGWKEIALPDSERAYRGDRDGALPVESKLYVQDVPGRAEQVLVLVSATSGGMGGAYMAYSPECESDEDDFREGNSGVNRSFAQCLAVMQPYSSESVIRVLAPALQPLVTSGALAVPPSLFTIMSRHAISTGAFLDVRVFVTSPIAATGSPVTDTVPKGVPREHVAWGRLLKDAVKSSIYSISGRLDVPPLQLAPAKPPKPMSVAQGG